MSAVIRVAILDDHQSIIDGYLFRLNPVKHIEVVITATVSSELERNLVHQATDVLLLDVNVPASAEDSTPQPVLDVIGRLVRAYPHLVIIMISMYAERTLVKALLAAGISGYILKDDHNAIQNLGEVILQVVQGRRYFSPRILEQLPQEDSV
jgi:DNA-binding NarL/FixJ family response regulator